MKNSNFIRFSWTTLAVIFLVIIAGSVVRMTGSGMGCPDWPKCFGHLLPPTDEAEVEFQPNTSYEKGQMIIVEDELLSAKRDFTSSQDFSATNWELYEQHDYAVFNVAHTWTEYINRLFGALSGLFVLVLFLWSLLLAVRKKIPWFVVGLTFITLILLGFQAWLGKIVVDSNLASAKITAHLFGAFALIVTMLLTIRFSNKTNRFLTSKFEKSLAWLSILLLLVQVYLGTEVRVLVDDATNHLGVISSAESYHHLFATNQFYIHRSFAWLLLICIGYWCWKMWKTKQWKPIYNWIIGFLLAEILIGISMAKFDFPFLSQPIHLLLACLLFACLFWLAIANMDVESESS